MAKFPTATRTVRNAGPGRTLWLPAVEKADGRLPGESSVEFKGLLELSFDKDITKIRVQPRTFELTALERTCSYTPDAEYVRRSGVIGYREFKSSLLELDEETKALLTAASQQISDRGFEYSVRDLKQIQGGFRLDNIRLLRRYRRDDCPEAFAREVTCWVANSGHMTFGALRERTGQARLRALMRLFWEQRLTFDMASEMLGFSTHVRVGDVS